MAGPFLAVAAVVATALSPVQAPQIQLASEANPLAGKPFYVDPISKAMRAAQSASPPSPQLDYVANTPQAYWLDQAFPASTVGGTVSKLVGAAQGAGATPVAVDLRAPAPRLLQLCGRWFRIGRRVPGLDRRHLGRPGCGPGGDHPGTRCARDGRSACRPISVPNSST